MATRSGRIFSSGSVGMDPLPNPMPPCCITVLSPRWPCYILSPPIYWVTSLLTIMVYVGILQVLDETVCPRPGRGNLPFWGCLLVAVGSWPRDCGCLGFGLLFRVSSGFCRHRAFSKRHKNEVSVLCAKSPTFLIWDLEVLPKPGDQKWLLKGSALLLGYIPGPEMACGAENGPRAVPVLRT